MKNIFLLVFVAGALNYCTAQKLTMDKVPADVAQAFKIKFPNGSQLSWNAVTDVFAVQFFNGKKRQSASFDISGKWMLTETEINYNTVPEKVQSAFEREFDGYQVQEVYQVETSDKGTNYNITTFKGAKNYEALFSAKGELLKKEAGEVNE